MSNHTPDEYQSSGVECPTCGRDKFTSEQSMKAHHTQVHGESIAGVEVQCEWCGDTKRVSPSRVDGRNHFCDYDCRSAFASENTSGEDSWHWEGGEFEAECHVCGGEIEVPRGDYYENDRHFCGDGCESEWRSEFYSGENHPRWGDGHWVNCAWCGEQKRVTTAEIERYSRHFCDNKCHGKWQSANVHGDNHPLSKDGETKYGPGWNYKKKEAVRERDARVCVSCGLGEAEHIERFGCKNPVHHIVKARKFNDPEKRNDKGNLVTLCKAGCHAKWEIMSPLRPE